MSRISVTPSTRCIRGTRAMHQSTLTLGDPTKSFYSTTHAESFSRKGRDGKVLIFQFRDSCYPSQHLGNMELTNIPVTQGQTHSRDVHDLKEIIPHYILHQAGTQNRSLNQEGFVMKEATNPAEGTLYQSTYQTAHATTLSSNETSEVTNGHSVTWHSHDVITGEEKSAAGPGRAKRPSRERELWAARRWEMHHDSLRLY